MQTTQQKILQTTLSRFFLFSLISFFTVQFASALTPVRSYSAQYTVFSKDNHQLIFVATGPHKSELIKMDSRTGKVLKQFQLTFNPNAHPFAATPDGFKILADSPNGIEVIHNGTGKVLRTLPYPSKIRNFRMPSVQSDDGVLLAVPSINPHERKIFLVHTGSGKVLHHIDLFAGEKWQRFPEVRSIGFNHNRRLVAYEIQAGGRTSLRIYDLYKKTETHRITLPNDNFEYGKLQFSKDDQYIQLSANNRKNIKLINLKQNSVQTLNYPFSSFVGFNPADQLIIVQAYDNTITLHDITTGRARKNYHAFFQKGGDYAYPIAQSADRSLIALPHRTLNPDAPKQFILVDTRTGQISQKLKAH